ncbi:SpoIIE family protein phosphatase [Streptacidiphilus jiangxiensis]|nr:SpoIIE family protein phosphatase [Streptacidiphilus jiangxiensis]
MSSGRSQGAPGRAAGPVPPGALLDLLHVAAVVLDTSGRIIFWSPQAEEVFGYTTDEALGRYAGRLLVHEEHRGLVADLFAEVMATGSSWAGAFPVRHKDGSAPLVEFRNMRLTNERGEVFALGIAVDHDTLRRVETDLALSQRLVSQAPIGLALMNTDLRYVMVNPALERINGLPAAEHIGRRTQDIVPHLDTTTIESGLRHVLLTGTPLLDQYIVGRTPADPDHDHAWSVSTYRLDDPGGRVIGVAISVIDVSERHRAGIEADRARRRLDLIAKASARVGTTLEVAQTAQELADAAVPDLADLAAVDILDAVLEYRTSRPADENGPELFRALALASAYPTDAATAADTVGEPAAYSADRLITRCVRAGRPILVSHAGPEDLLRIARDSEAAAQLQAAGAHSYLAVPLIARNEVLGAFDMLRARNPLPFDADDVLLAGELAARAAVAIDNARWHQSVRNVAETLQRSLLPEAPPDLAGLEVAAHYQPAQAAHQVGGDWYDIIPLPGDRTALVVGDVMGNGIDAAATMGRLRTATCAFADLDLEPDEVLTHLDKITGGLERYIATCLYAVYNPHHHRCRIANAGHLPPALAPADRPPELVDLPTGVPLGVGGVPFRTIAFDLHPGDRLVMFTDGLVETRHDPIDARLAALLRALDMPRVPLAEACPRLVSALRQPDDHDDVALLIAQAGRT